MLCRYYELNFLNVTLSIETLMNVNHGNCMLLFCDEEIK